jgi:hypothetical protein
MSEDSRNNFKRLAQEEDMKPRDDKQIKGSISFISSISKVIELYLPGFFQLLISISGGGSKNAEKAPGPPNSGISKRDNEQGPSEPPTK